MEANTDGKQVAKGMREGVGKKTKKGVKKERRKDSKEKSIDNT